MNEYIYSPSANAFYPLSLQESYEIAGTWPQDGVSVSAEIAAEFMQAAPQGKKRIAGDDGYPVWEDIPPPTQDELIASAEMEKQSRINQANDYMNGKQWPGKAALGRLKGDDLAHYNAWLDYLDAMEAVDITTALDITWPDKPTL
ncbi:tail fiber assembly protein [Leclercia sp.]|uniref:tail fiber assembly protein n=1 Tax=Leclercia sp. TaxID=1898428 RepID=UPI00289BF2CE|nr:tail fiber assembly protein [Leclercia sp.]